MKTCATSVSLSGAGGGTLYNGGSDLEFKKLKLVGGPSVICFWKPQFIKQ